MYDPPLHLLQPSLTAPASPLLRNLGEGGGRAEHASCRCEWCNTGLASGSDRQPGAAFSPRCVAYSANRAGVKGTAVLLWPVVCRSRCCVPPWVLICNRGRLEPDTTSQLARAAFQRTMGPCEGIGETRGGGGCVPGPPGREGLPRLRRHLRPDLNV
jgi:hypothetical protein